MGEQLLPLDELDRLAIQGRWKATGLGLLTVKGSIVKYDTLGKKQFQLKRTSDNRLALGDWRAHMESGAWTEHIQWSCHGCSNIVWQKLENRKRTHSSSQRQQSPRAKVKKQKVCVNTSSFTVTLSKGFSGDELALIEHVRAQTTIANIRATPVVVEALAAFRFHTIRFFIGTRQVKDTDLVVPPGTTTSHIELCVVVDPSRCCNCGGSDLADALACSSCARPICSECLERYGPNTGILASGAGIICGNIDSNWDCGKAFCPRCVKGGATRH